LAFFKDKKRLNDFTTREELALNFISFAILRDAAIDFELAQTTFDSFVKHFNQLGTNQLPGFQIAVDVSETLPLSWEGHAQRRWTRSLVVGPPKGA
jgi:hypothetical protein